MNYFYTVQIFFLLNFQSCSIAFKESYFFIYPWPESVISVQQNKFDSARLYNENYGLGKLLDESSFLFETSPYSLFRYMYFRLSLHPRRTFDPEKAEIFFIPYDVTHDTWESSMLFNRDNRSAYVVSFLSSSKYFLKNRGKDHFYIEDDSPFYSWKHEVSAWKSFHQICKNCVLVTPDNTASLREEFSSIIRPDSLVSAPHPAAYHFIPNCILGNCAQVVPWSENFENHSSVITSVVGTVNKASKFATKIRFILDKQCQQANNTKVYKLSHPFFSFYMNTKEFSFLGVRKI